MNIIIYNHLKTGVLVEVNAIRNADLEELAKKIVPKGTNYKIIDQSELPTDQSNRDAWYLAEDGTIQVDQARLEALKPLATGPGFMESVRVKLEVQNVINDIPVETRAKTLSTIENTLRNWYSNNENNDFWDIFKGMTTDLTQKTWDDFKSAIEKNKFVEGNNLQLNTSTGPKLLGDLLLGFIAEYESKHRFLSKEEFEKKYVV